MRCCLFPLPHVSHVPCPCAFLSAPSLHAPGPLHVGSALFLQSVLNTSDVATVIPNLLTPRVGALQAAFPFSAGPPFLTPSPSHVREVLQPCCLFLFPFTPLAISPAPASHRMNHWSFLDTCSPLSSCSCCLGCQLVWPQRTVQSPSSSILPYQVCQSGDGHGFCSLCSSCSSSHPAAP